MQDDKSPQFKSPIAPLQESLPFSEIEWAKFEKLCRSLTDRISPFSNSRLYGTQGDIQEDIDIYLETELEKFETSQCKHVKDLSPKLITDSVNDFLEGAWVNKTNSFLILSSSTLKKDMMLF